MIQNNVTCIIPARLGSTRFFGKALSKINGMSMVVYVAKNAIDAFGRDNVVVLTDCESISKECIINNIMVEITGTCNNSTERIYHYIDKIKTEWILELQGDEPLITKEDLINLYDLSKIKKNPTCLLSPLRRNQLEDKNICKAITNDTVDKIIYITRFPIDTGYRHIGVYCYTKKHLKSFNITEQTKLECLEKIHPMKWIELGYEYNCYVINHFTHGVDVPSDLSIIQTYLNYENDQL